MKKNLSIAMVSISIMLMGCSQNALVKNQRGVASESEDCKSSDPDLKIQSITCNRDKDVIVASSLSYRKDDKEFPIIFSEANVNEICKKLGASRGRVDGLQNIYSYFSKGFNFESMELIKLAPQRPPIKSVVCRYSEKASSTFFDYPAYQLDENNIAYVMLYNGTDTYRKVLGVVPAKNLVNEKSREVAGRYCITMGFDRATSWSFQPISTKEPGSRQDWENKIGAKINDDFTLTIERLADSDSRGFYVGPVILKDVTCQK